MILIAHRGNTLGPNPEQENLPGYIMEALEQGYNAEMDVWYYSHCLYAGHDAPMHRVPGKLLVDDRVWFHAKNLDALRALLEAKVPHVFYHVLDDFTLTSCGHIWTYPGKMVCPLSILTLVGPCYQISEDVHGVCGDYVGLLK